MLFVGQKLCFLLVGILPFQYDCESLPRWVSYSASLRKELLPELLYNQGWSGEELTPGQEGSFVHPSASFKTCTVHAYVFPKYVQYSLLIMLNHLLWII